MRGTVRNKSICILTASAALVLGGAIVCCGVNSVTAHADENSPNYYAFVDVGANDKATAVDTALGLTEKNATVATAGTLTEGDTLFGSYSTGAKYSFALDAGEYQVAVAIIAESGNNVDVGGQAADYGEAAGHYVVSTTATVTAGTPLTVEVSGKLCAILVADTNSKILMSAEYTAGQVISYGALLSEELENATGYYSNGDKEEVKIEYSGITANTGVNVNFTMVDVTGKIEGTNLTVSRYVLTMPDDLVYFINSGSSTQDNIYGEGEGQDPYYDYNQMVFDYYGDANNGGTLINYGNPDGKVDKNGSKAGYYSDSIWSAPGDSAFPYNTLLWNAKGKTEMGYILPGLDNSKTYRVYIGTLSHWHARTVTIKFNNETVGASDLRINASKGYSVYEGVSPKSGKIDINMEGGSTNEPCINFIAVQEMDTEIKAIPSVPVAISEIGMTEHAVTITDGLVDGAKLQLYNASRPNQVLYEEKVDMTKAVTEEGGEAYTYSLDWGNVFDGISQFYLVQITNGGVSPTHRITVTDIEGFEVALSTEGYTTGSVTVHVTAHANSGITAWSYQLGEYGTVNQFAMDKPATLNESFTVQANGEYIVKVYSGVGAKNDKTVVIGNIDPERPVITITPSKRGWQDGEYNVTLAVRGIAPVAEYKLYKDGAEIKSATAAPSTITFTEYGEYLIYVKNEAGQSAMNTLSVCGQPTMTNVINSYANRTLTYTFADNAFYKVVSVTAYEVTDTGISRMTIGDGNTMDVYDEGTYVVAVTTSNGTVEMFSLNVTEDDLDGKNVTPVGGSSGVGSSTALAIGLGVGIGGVVLAAAAVTVTLILKKKKAQ